MIPSVRRITLGLEAAFLFIFMPGLLYFYGRHGTIAISLWIFCSLALLLMSKDKTFFWKDLWHGRGWLIADRRFAILRFLIATPALIFLAFHLVPDRLFSLPLQRPGFWLLIMILYPLLSVIPQEILFRSFFFRRYQPLFSHSWILLVASALAFSFVHIVFHNMISPGLSFVGGLIFAFSYRQHRSLKWAVIEHAAYGCMVFTVGLGIYFFVGSVKP